MSSNTERERWNQRYDTEDYVFGTEPSDFLVEQANIFHPGQRVLVIADGEGRNGVFLAERGLDVTSFDIAPHGIAKARRLAQSRGVSLAIREGNVATWNWAESPYDAVVGIFFQFVGPQLRTRVFQGIATALKPGGLALLHGYTPKQLVYRTGGPSEVENLYTSQLLQDSFPDFEVLHLLEKEKILSEGSRHSGMSALIDFVARKPTRTNQPE